MEDPWSSGSAWASASKPAAKSPSPPPSPPVAALTPPRSLDVSDPWGAPTPAAIVDGRHDNGLNWSGEQNDGGAAQKPATETPGWGGGWGGNSEPEVVAPIAGPSRSPPGKPQDSPEWGFSGAPKDVPDLSIPDTHPVDLAAPINHLPLTSPPASPPFNAPPSPPHSPPVALNLDSSGSRLPQSPSFGDDFGGFSSGFGGDPWGTKQEDTGWGQSSARASSASGQSRRSSVDQRDTGDGWAGASGQIKTEITSAEKSGMDNDWEEAQQRIRIAEQRAPREKIESLKADWNQLVSALVGEHKLDSLDDGLEQEYIDRLRRQSEQIAETLHSLSTLPPDINTYPPVLSSFETYERYQYALKRPNTVPETSLLNMPMGRRSRRLESALDNLDSWTSRSRLGEPEAPQPEANQQAGETKSKWSFWRKPTAEKPLVTSGGGILEVKSASPAPTPAPIEPRPSIGSATSKPSRPASPAPSVLSASDNTATAPSAATSPPPPPAGPSAVSRFFGRLSRRQTSQSVSSFDKGDMEFSADDFSFLDQVPSMSTPDREKAVGDLLSMEGGRTEEIASLESMLRSKPTPLPAPLAPPPVASRTPSSSRIPSNPPKRDMDLLSGLEFDGPSSSPVSTDMPAAAGPSAPRASLSSSAWDDFLATAPITKPDNGPTQPRQPLPPPNSLSPALPALHPQPARPLAPAQHAPLSSYAPAPLKTSQQSDFDDFADFAPTPPAHQTNQTNEDFDDFGDFGGFSTPAPAAPRLPPSQPAISNHLQTPSTSGHAKRSSLDHTLTLNLLNEASTSKGKQWPAPPSPLAPSLEPPPKAPNAANKSSANFPFISPPSGSSRPGVSSGLGDLMNENFGGSPPSHSSVGSSTPAPPVRIQSPPMASSVPMQPFRSASPAVPANIMPTSRPGSTAPIAEPSQQESQSGLSAQDLSFFDNL